MRSIPLNDNLGQKALDAMFPGERFYRVRFTDGPSILVVAASHDEAIARAMRTVGGIVSEAEGKAIEQ